VTVLQVVPALLRSILERMPHELSFRALSRLRWLISTGSSLAPNLLRDWFRHFPNVPLINAYGASECSDDVATQKFAAAPALLATVPIGRAIPNTRLYVLDSHLQPVAVRVAGELYVAGAGVGRGYLNNPEQTGRSFLRDPFANRRGARLYRTGDWARWRADGALECLGRVDQLVKIRGHRIELEEVEHVLVEHPAVQAAVVLARNDTGGEARLVAHIVAAGGREPELNELHGFLKTRLPEYMLPAAFTFLQRIPLTDHGKVDRPALLAMRGEPRAVVGKFVAPRDTDEEILTNIWVDLLKVENIGVSDNFFDLGGHSLLAGQVLARVASAFGVSLPIKVVFEAPTVEGLARRIDEARDAQPSEAALEIGRIEEADSHSMSIAQEDILRVERELPGLPQFNLPIAYRLRGPLNVHALERSLHEAVGRHDSLRTRFAWVRERPTALVARSCDIGSPLVIEDIAARMPAGNRRVKALLVKKAELEAEQDAWTPFDMARAPLLRVRLLRLGTNDHVLLLTLHHIIVDGWSIGVIMEEVSELYDAFTARRQIRLPEPEFQFSDFARWQRAWSASGAAIRQLGYWKENLRGALPLFPTHGDAGHELVGTGVGHEPVHLPNDFFAQLQELSRRQGATLFITLLAAFKVLLLARSGCDDICVATVMANRAQLKAERVIGPVDNTILIRTRIDANLSFQEALGRVRASVLEAYAKQELPFEVLAARLTEEESLNPVPLLRVFFVLQNAFRRPLTLPNVAVRSFGNIYREGLPVLSVDRTWLAAVLRETPSGVIGAFSYKDNLFERRTIQHWIADYRTILAKAAAKPETPLGRLADC
jgi:NRPS condensation-like uncharacterized protein